MKILTLEFLSFNTLLLLWIHKNLWSGSCTIHISAIKNTLSTGVVVLITSTGEGEVKKKPSKRECVQAKAMCSPYGEEYLTWKRKIIEQAEAATNTKKRRTK